MHANPRNILADRTGSTLVRTLIVSLTVAVAGLLVGYAFGRLVL